MKKIQNWLEVVIIAIQIGIALFTLKYIFIDIRNTPIYDFLYVALVIIIVITKVLKLKMFKYILSIFLLIGVFNIWNTSVFSLYSYLKWGSGFEINIDFNIFYFVLFILYITTYYKDILAYLDKRSNTTLEEQNKKSDYYMIKYYNELKDKDDLYLQNIIQTKEKWQKEFVLAAQKVFDDRKFEL